MGRTKTNRTNLCLSKKKYFASILKMASYNRHSNNLDKDLDGLSFSYLDGVPFRLDPRIEAVNNYDFSRVDSLVNRALPTPGLSEMCDNIIQKMGVLEKRVLRELEAAEEAKEAKK